MRLAAAIGLLASSLLFTPGCGENEARAPSASASAPPAGFRFEDITRSCGISFVHRQGQHVKYLPETMAPGVALLDYDGDGLLDVFLVQGSGPANGHGTGKELSCRLFRNCGDHFQDVTDEAGSLVSGFGMACQAADLGNGGCPDLVVTAYGQANALLVNNGDGTFREAAGPLGVQGDGRWNSFASFFDFDRDGLLDFYLGRYLAFRAQDWVPDPREIPVKEFGNQKMPQTMVPDQYPPQDKTLFKNRWPLPFQDVTAAAGVADADGRGLGAVATDLDGDGWPDLFVANDASPCGVYLNRGDGTFADIRRSSWGGETRGSMGLALSDYRGDGSLALLVTHFMLDYPALYSKRISRSGKRGVVLLDHALAAGLGEAGQSNVGWGCGFYDWDRDGWEDMLIINGSTNYPADGPKGTLEAQPAAFFLNDGHGHFARQHPQLPGDPLAHARVGRGAAFGDLFRDGSPDVIVGVNNGPTEVWKAVCPDRGWVGLMLAGTRSNRDAIGAFVELDGAGRRQIREVVSGDSYFSSSARDLLFGLGAHRDPARATVRWPSGVRETFADLRPGRYWRLVEGTGRAAP